MIWLNIALISCAESQVFALIFCIISAIGNDYGAFNYQERLFQLKNTIESVHTFASGSDILLVEASEELIPENDLNYLQSKVNNILFWSLLNDITVSGNLHV